jgi:CDP-diacylglycerol--glycerol-3-phosphate 3-phosphatidyltransferase
LARLSNHETHFGAFLDSIFDHCGDFAVYLGLLWLYLNNNSRTEVILIFLALFGSILGSQVRSRAGMMGIDTKTTGLFTRFERIFVLTIGLVTDKVIFALWVLAVMNNFSSLQRIVYSIQARYSSKAQIKEKD